MIQIEKKIIRAKIKALRKSQPENIKNLNDISIQNTLLKLPEIKKARFILIYVSSTYEVNTLKVIKILLQQGKTIIVPKVKTLAPPLLSLHKITSLKNLKSGNYNILEPVDTTQQVDQNSIDLAIIPGIAFDRNLNRIGYGKGYFDVLLYGFKAKKIALAYDFQIVHNIPAEPHDKKMDLIITENEIIQ